MAARHARRTVADDWRLYVAAGIVGILLIVVWVSTWSPIFRICEQSEGTREICRPLSFGDAAVWLTLLVALAFAAPYMQKYIKRLSIPGVGEVETQDKLPPQEDVPEENKAIDEKAEEYRRWLKSAARQRREDQE